jgi:hypothetical protein
MMVADDQDPAVLLEVARRRRYLLRQRDCHAVARRGERRCPGAPTPRPLGPALCMLALLALARGVRAQGGPPYITNDPGTPGGANWEINIGSMPTIEPGVASYQLPQIDLNFGVGSRIQLTYEVPYVIQSGAGQSVHTGWSNAYPGIKWRFFDQGEHGWQISTFPQLETAGTANEQRDGIAENGPRFLLPFEVAKTVGPVDLDFEAGYYFPWHGAREHILGLVAGRSFTKRLELDAEVYDDRAVNALPHSTTLDAGGRYRLHRGFILLVMAGRSVSGAGSGQQEFMGYLGLQLLLSNYGLTLTPDS